MWDVIEHVERPSDLLKFAKKVLKKGGWIFAYTENLDSFNYFINGSYSEMFSPDVHLRHYTPLTFRNEFEKAGFKVCDILTKGLDIQHIKTISEVYPEPFKLYDFEYNEFENNNLFFGGVNAVTSHSAMSDLRRGGTFAII